MRSPFFASLAVAGLALFAGCGGGSPTVKTASVALPGEFIGQVVVSAEVPAAQCRVLVEGAPLAGTCDEDGYFDIRHVPAGRWDMHVQTDDAIKSLPARRVVGGANAGFLSDLGTVLLAKPGSIGGRIVNSSGANLGGGVVAVPSLGAATAPSDQGAYFLDGIAPGQHDVLLLTESGTTLHANVDVEPGKTTIGIDFDFTTLKSATAHVTGTALRQGADDGTNDGITVELVETIDGKVIDHTTTAKDGSFTLSGAQKTYLVRATDGSNAARPIIPAVVLGDADVALTSSLVVPPADGDLDGDGIPDAIDTDIDGDGYPNAVGAGAGKSSLATDDDPAQPMDAFPFDPNEWKDTDGDGVGDRSDLKSLVGGTGIDTKNPTPDTDGDGKFDFEDDCPKVKNADQKDSDGDGVGDACDDCPFVADPTQADSKGDGVGDACRVGCLPASCLAQGKSCGMVADGCGAMLDCGACTGSDTCGGGGVPNVCGHGCLATTCAATGKNCGMAADGCGGMLDCGACDPSMVCGAGGVANVCGVACTPTTCSAEKKSCGVILDGCGGFLDCGGCTAPASCGGGGVDNVCGVPCTPMSCVGAGKNCGLLLDGCGGVVDCGGCGAGDTCGGGGTANLCGHACVATSCAATGKNCGALSDGCGNMLDCGGCTGGDTCGGGGIDNVCGSTCAPLTCLGTGKNCGTLSDGCGGTLSCGACGNAGDTCGGGGVANVCGQGCVKVSCASLGKNCGQLPDGCGGMLDCGGCTAPDTCNPTGNTPNVCGTCAGFLTCAMQGKNCGTVADGCGGTLDCGGCNAPNSCGGGGMANVCGEGTHGLSVVSGEGGTAVGGESPPAVIIQVTDASGSAAPNVQVTFTAPAGGGVVPAQGVTDNAGQITATLVLPRVPGAYTYSAVADQGGSLSLHATATAPPTGMSQTFPLVNAQHVAGESGIPGPGIQAQVGANVYGVATSSDGSVYFVDGDLSSVFALSPSGNLTRIAGVPHQSGKPVEFGPAATAQLNAPKDLALDDKKHILYVSDSSNNAVYGIDVSSPAGVIWTAAGGGSVVTAPYGDGGPANQATLSSPLHLTLGPDGALYIGDVLHTAIRRVDGTTGFISTFMSTGKGCTVTEPATVSAGGATAWVKVVFDDQMNAFISGLLCVYGDYQAVSGIVRRAPDGTTTVVAGNVSGVVSDGIAATAVQLGDIVNLAIDPAGNLYLTEAGSGSVRRIDSNSGIITTVAGTGTPGNSADFLPATQTQFKTPWGLAFDDAQDLVIGDFGNASVRLVSAIGAQSSTVTISPTGGTNQTPLIDQQLSSTLSVTALDALGQVVPGLAVTFAPLTDGAGVYGASTFTNTSGVASVGVRVGWSATSYQWSATATDIHGNTVGQPVMFTATATAPSVSTVFPVLNATRGATLGGYPGPAAMARMQQPAGLAIDGAGNVYVSDQMQAAVVRIAPSGAAEIIAGGNGPGFGGDLGPATDAKLYQPHGLAVDTTRNLLFISDQYNGRVRVVDLSATPPSIDTYAGNGSVGAPPFGDGGPGPQAQLSSPGHLSIGPDGALYIADTAHNVIRRVDPVSKVINTYVDSAYANITHNALPCTSPNAVFYACGYTDACSTAWGADGNLYLSAQLCGGASSTSFPGVLRVNVTDGSESGVAGCYSLQPGCKSGDGQAATSTLMGGFIAGLAFDPAGDLLFADRTAFAIRRVDATAKTISTIAGDGNNGYLGDYVPAGGARVSAVTELMFIGPHLLFTDGTNSMVREIY